MSESDTIFNERDRRCASIQLMLSTDPSYDNRTIASTLKMQIQTVQRLCAQLNDPLEVVERKATSCHLTSSKSAWKSTPKCTWMCWRVWWSPCAIRWPVADPYGSMTRRRPTSPKRPRLSFSRSATTLYPSLTGPPPPPAWTRWTISFGHMSRTSPTWPPTTPKPAWSPPSTEYSPSSRRRLWKTYAPSSGSVSRRSLRLKVATLNRCQLNYITKLPELIFSIKVLKYSCSVVFFRTTILSTLFMYIYIPCYKYIYAHMHIYTYITYYIDKLTQTQMHIYIITFIYSNTDIYITYYRNILTHIHTHTYIYISLFTYTHTQTRVYIYIYIYIYI